MPKEKQNTSKEIHSSSDPVAKTTETKPKSSESSPSEDGLTSTTSVTDDTRPENVQPGKETDGTETGDSLTACTPTEVQNQQKSGNVGDHPTITKAPKQEKTPLKPMRSTRVHPEKLKLLLQNTVARRRKYALKATRDGSQTQSSPSYYELERLRQKVKIILEVKQKFRDDLESINTQFTLIGAQVRVIEEVFKLKQMSNLLFLLQDYIMKAARDALSDSLKKFLTEYISVREDLELSNKTGLSSRVKIDKLKSKILDLTHSIGLFRHQFETSEKMCFGTSMVEEPFHQYVMELEKNIFILKAILSDYEENALEGREVKDFKIKDAVELYSEIMRH